MKKQNLKSLKLNKKKISNFKPVMGGRPPKSHFRRECEEPVEVSISCFIESNCIGCSITTVSQ